MSDLKPCSGCNETEMLRVELGIGLYCDNCGLFVEYEGGDYDAIVDKWNTRPLEDALINERDELKRQLEEDEESRQLTLIALKNTKEISKETLETAIEALEYYKKINYCWSASRHPKYEKCEKALEELKKRRELP